MLTYALDRKSDDPLYVQLYQGIRRDIEAAAIPAGQKLPSKRALAQHLGVSVITVEGAYAQLTAEGYVEARAHRGFFACETAAAIPAERFGDAATGREVAPPLPASSGRASDVEGERGSDATAAPRHTSPFDGQPEGDPGNGPAWLADFTGASPAAGSFPYEAWARTMRKVLSDSSESTLLSCSDGRGTVQLRRAIADHLRGFRGMDVHPDQVVVGSGAQSLYGLLVQLLGRNRVFALENPGYRRLARIYKSHGAQIRLVGMDEKGPLVTQLHGVDADVFHCMPSHQFPTGVTTSVGRRRKLLEWASLPGADGQPRYLVEDDYDCEFRMSGRPIPPLQAMDRSESVIYANTFAKTLGPAFRIGYMVLPPHLARRFRQQLGFYACTVGALEQLTLARFMESGEYERHVNRQRTRFRKVQDAFAKALAKEAKKAGVECVAKNLGAGLHFVLEVPTAPGEAAESDQAIAKRALAQGVALSPMEDYRLDGIVCQARAGQRDLAKAPDSSLSRLLARPSFVMNFASLREEDAAKSARVIAKAVASCR